MRESIDLLEYRPDKPYHEVTPSKLLHPQVLTWMCTVDYTLGTALAKWAWAARR